MKKLLILISLFYTISLTGQKVFMDEYKTSVVDSSFAGNYVVTDYEKDPKAFKVTVYYMTGDKESENGYLKSSGKNGLSVVWYLSGTSKKFVNDGKSTYWYKNGQLKSQGNYTNGKQMRKASTWFENGQTESEKNYVDGKCEGKSTEWYENGQLKSESDYINGQYDGVIKTYWKNGVVKRKDQYSKGKFKNGTCYDSLGKVIDHFELEVMPQYDGGDTQLLADISNKTRYPKVSRDSGIEGRVLVRFAVNEQGGISNIDIMDGINSELNREAVRVVGKLNRFKPGSYDGNPVKVYYMIPITFTLK